MKMYLLSVATGVLVGVIYGLFGVRSPAPPVVALIGLLGILLGEQSVPIARRVISGELVTNFVFRTQNTSGPDERIVRNPKFETRWVQVARYSGEDNRTSEDK
ncbi:DUF1427 family protein [Burkholderia sp. PU8-34]